MVILIFNMTDFSQPEYFNDSITIEVNQQN